MVIDCKHKLGSVVYLLTDKDAEKRVVTAITVRSGGYIVYELSNVNDVSSHVETEISKTPVYS